MIAKDVLEFFDAVMASYDRVIKNTLADGNLLNRNLLKMSEFERIKAVTKAASEVAPLSAYDFSAKYDEAEKIETSGLAAAEYATEQLVEEQDPAEYKRLFKEYFEASLRMELYKQFCVPLLRSYKSKLLIEFINANNGVTASPKNVLSYHIHKEKDKVLSEIKRYESHKKNLPEEDVKIIDNLKLDINEHLNEFDDNINSVFAGNNTDEVKIKLIRESALDFQVKTGQLLRKYQFKAESDSSWKPFLKNLALLLTGVGILPAVVSLIKKAVTGRYAFFDKESLRATPNDEKAAEDKLLTGALMQQNA